MGAERQQIGDDQLWLFEDSTLASPRPGVGGEGGTGPAACEASQATTALDPARALTEHLMEEVCQRENLNRAYRRVKSNRGAPGVDGMTIHDLATWIREHKEELIASLMDGSYQPQSVRRVDITKPDCGMRQLGIPTVVDRLVQQAILQVVEPLLDPTFSVSSYGFRPGRSAHDALGAASQYVADGRTIVVDLDLEKFLDASSHCTPFHEGRSKSPRWLSKTLIRKPLRLPRRRCTAESSPRFTRCKTVWRETPKIRIALNMST